MAPTLEKIARNSREAFLAIHNFLAIGARICEPDLLGLHACQGETYKKLEGIVGDGDGDQGAYSNCKDSLLRLLQPYLSALTTPYNFSKNMRA